LEYLEYCVLMTDSSLLANRDGDRRLMGAITGLHSGNQRRQLWQMMALRRRISGAEAR
jgi:hypothetical protein